MAKKQETAPEPEPLTWLSGPWRPRTSWLHPLYAAAGTYAAGQIVHGAETSPWWTAGSIALGAAGGLLATAGERFHDWTRAYLTSAGAFAGTWLTWAAATSPYNDASVIAAVVGAAVYAAGYPAMRHQQHEREDDYLLARTDPLVIVDEPGTDHDPGQDPDARRWEAFFASVGLKGLRYLDRIPNRAGFTVKLRLPINGSVTVNMVAAAAEKLEMAWPNGRLGMIRVERGRDDDGNELAAEVWVHFDVRNILTETIKMPDDHSPLSINDAFPVGLYTDGTPITLRLREVSSLIIGLRGRGKTNLLNVILHQLSRCTDVVLWMIDLKGGRAAKPWLQPFFDGRAKRRVIDWVATTRLEAHLMLLGALGLIQDRGRRAHGGSKITPSRETPAVMIICDELASLVGQHAGPRSRNAGQGATSRELSGLVTQISQLGRSEAVDEIGASQRITNSFTGGGDFKSQCELRIGMGVSSVQDAQSIFQGKPLAAKQLARLQGENTRGALLVQHGESRILMGKAYFMGDDQEMVENVHRAAIAHQHYPAELCGADAAAVEAAVRAYRNPSNPKDQPGRYGYTDRWSPDRCGHLYDNTLPPEVTDADIDQGADNTPTAPARGTATVTRLRPRRQFFRPRQRPKADAVSDEAWREIVAAYEGPTAPEPAPDPKPQPEPEPEDSSGRSRMIQIIREAGAVGTSPGRIYTQLLKEGQAPKARQTLYAWLGKAMDDRHIVQPGGPRGLYFTPENAP